MFNVSRNQIAPKSLEQKKKYDSQDVYDALNEIFFKKCYLCETKEPSDVNVEHFDAHKGDEEKKFDWQNLYLVCSRCNNIKGAKYNNLLDCCDKNIDVSRAVKHVPPITPYAKSVQILPTNDDEQTIETQELLNHIFNNNNTINKGISGAFLRRKVFDQYNLLLKQLDIYYSPTVIDDEKRIAIERMKVLIKKDSPYSAFLRWCILDDEELRPVLEEFMD